MPRTIVHPIGAPRDDRTIEIMTATGIMIMTRIVTATGIMTATGINLLAATIVSELAPIRSRDAVTHSMFLLVLCYFS